MKQYHGKNTTKSVYVCRGEVILITGNATNYDQY